uniref:Uncharacterized protein n=1 Tax=Grapevine-associated levi-like virus 7 TaxID=2814362 RepID=A0A8F5MJC8_9VIRU|nr:MAG: hypothetical protein [Grapevine-associated levi-like virus 7]
MADQAFEKLVPQVPQEVSLPNFLYELRDVAALVPKLDASMAKTVSGGYLNYQFGWKPFIGDLKKLGSLLDTVNRRLDYLRKTYGKETRISFTTTFTAVDIGISLFDPKSVGISQTSGGYTEFEGTFRCGAHLYHKLKGLDGLQGVMRGAAGALGLNNPAGVVWEAIPYSFVADWFGNLGEQIQRQAYQPFEGDWDLRNMSHSFRYTFKHETWHGPKAYGADYPDVPYMSYRQSGEHYERGEGLPASGLYLTTTDFGPQQQKLAAALIHQFA